MAEYWLVIDDRNLREIALVRVTGNRAVVIAGDAIAEQGFYNGRPNTLEKPFWLFQILTAHAWHPLVGDAIDRLGTVVNSGDKLRKQLDKKRIRQRGQNLAAAVISDIEQLLVNGVSQRKIAAKYGVSKSFVQRLNSSEPPT